MSVTSEQQNSPGVADEASIHPRSSCASCGEVSAEHDHDHEHGFELIEVLRVAFVVLAAAAVWFHLWEPFHRVSVIGLAATLIGGYPIFKEAFENILERRMTMELSMTIALLSALAIGEFFTALVITAFVLGAEILEGLTVGRGRRAIQDMLNFLPQTASVLRDGQTLEVPTDTIGLRLAIPAQSGQQLWPFRAASMTLFLLRLTLKPYPQGEQSEDESHSPQNRLE
jgi:cation transport ATPase